LQDPAGHKAWGLSWIQAHADGMNSHPSTRCDINTDLLLAAKKAGKPVIIEEFGVSGLQNKTDIYPEWISLALKTKHA